MGTERSELIQPCPYWRKYQQVGDYVLAMCAVNSENDPPYRDLEGIPRRLKECPLFGRNGVYLAFEMPAIFEFRINNRVFTETGYVVESDFNGYGGVFQLEDIWDQEVEEFIQRHFQE